MRTSETPFYLLIVAILFGWGFGSNGVVDYCMD